MDRRYSMLQKRIAMDVDPERASDGKD